MKQKERWSPISRSLLLSLCTSHDISKFLVALPLKIVSLWGNVVLKPTIIHRSTRLFRVSFKYFVWIRNYIVQDSWIQIFSRQWRKLRPRSSFILMSPFSIKRIVPPLQTLELWKITLATFHLISTSNSSTWNCSFFQSKTKFQFHNIVVLLMWVRKRLLWMKPLPTDFTTYSIRNAHLKLMLLLNISLFCIPSVFHFPRVFSVLLFHLR